MKTANWVRMAFILPMIAVLSSCPSRHENYVPNEKVYLFETNWTNPYLCHPTDMFIATNDNIFIIDNDLDAVEIYDKNMNYINGWVDSSLYGSFGITVNPKMDKVYVADTRNYRMVVYNMIGQMITNINGLYTIVDIIVDNKDNIYLLANNNLYKMNSNFQILTNVLCEECYGLVFDGYGNVCTLDSTNIYKFKTNDLSLANSFPITWGGDYIGMMGADLAISIDYSKFYKINHPDTYFNTSIDVYDTNGEYKSKIDVLQIDDLYLSANTAISFDSSGKLYLLAAVRYETYFRLFKFK